MTDLEDRPPPAVGAYWINEEDYPALLKILADGNTLPRTWKEWLKIAEEMESGLKAYGHVVMRVRIDPKTCLTYGFNGNTGEKDTQAKMSEGHIYSAIAHALDIEFPERYEMSCVLA